MSIDQTSEWDLETAKAALRQERRRDRAGAVGFVAEALRKPSKSATVELNLRCLYPEAGACLISPPRVRCLHGAKVPGALAQIIDAPAGIFFSRSVA